MRIQLKVSIFSVLIVGLGIGGYFGYRSIFYNEPEPVTDDDGWTKIDQDYKARHPVEKYIKEGAESRNEFPVFIKNYGKDPSMLKKFSGSYFTYPSEEEVNSTYGEDWIIIDIKYKRNDGKEIYRRFLCAKSKNGWFPADFGPPIE